MMLWSRIQNDITEADTVGNSMVTTIANQKNKRDRFTRRAEALKAKINELSGSLYNLDTRDPELRYENLKTYRAEMIRGFVVYMHLVTEDLLKALFVGFLVKLNRSLPNREAKRTVDNM